MTQKIIFYDVVERESQELEKKREAVKERLDRIAERKMEMNKKFEKVCVCMCVTVCMGKNEFPEVRGQVYVCYNI